MKTYTKYILTGIPLLIANNTGNKTNAADKIPDNIKPKYTLTQSSGINTPVDTSSKFVFAEKYGRRGVVYKLEDGSQIIRTNGTRQWRNNNAGAIQYGDFARKNGAIGTDGRFAIFPDYETGFKALQTLLKTETYKNLTIQSAIYTYAPPSENNVSAYLSRLKHLTGISLKLRIRDLDDAQLHDVANAIETIEGWVPGTETVIPSDTLLFAKNHYTR